MRRRQTVPEQWLILDRPPARETWAILRRLPRGSGILLLHDLTSSDRRRLRYLAKARALGIVAESAAARVHDSRELREALLRRAPLILISPLYPTRSHPDWRPLPRMRAGALARLAGRKAIALGGMDPVRFARLRPLGFSGWAGIDAWKVR